MDCHIIIGGWSYCEIQCYSDSFRISQTSEILLPMWPQCDISALKAIMFQHYQQIFLYSRLYRNGQTYIAVYRSFNANWWSIKWRCSISYQLTYYVLFNKQLPSMIRKKIIGDKSDLRGSGADVIYGICFFDRPTRHMVVTLSRLTSSFSREKPNSSI